MEREMPESARALTIEDWRACLLGCRDVVAVERVVHADGTSRKSAGGDHLSPYELYAYMGGMTKRQRITTGFTKHRGFLHTYCRTPPQHLASAMAEVFAEACRRFEKMAFARATPLPPKPPSVLVCLATFHMDGDEYLAFEPGDAILPRPKPDCDSAGWAYGILMSNGTAGWYPPSFATLSSGEPTAC